MLIFLLLFTRITRAKRVPEDFHARYSAQSRTYVYRLAHGASHHFLLPLTERDFCWHLGDTWALRHSRPPPALSLLFSILFFSSSARIVSPPQLGSQTSGTNSQTGSPRTHPRPRRKNSGVLSTWIIHTCRHHQIRDELIICRTNSGGGEREGGGELEWVN